MKAFGSSRTFVPFTSLGVITRKRTVFMFIIPRLCYSFHSSKVHDPYLARQFSVSSLLPWIIGHFPSILLYRPNPLHSHATFLSWNWRQHFAPKRWCSLIPLIGVATHRDIMWKFVIDNTVNKIGNVHVNVTLRYVCVIIVFVESITYSKCVSVAFVVEHAVRMRRTCHLWPIWLYHILLHYMRIGKIFGVKLLGIKCVFWFPVQLLSETFLILRRISQISS